MLSGGGPFVPSTDTAESPPNHLLVLGQGALKASRKIAVTAHMRQ